MNFSKENIIIAGNGSIIKNNFFIVLSYLNLFLMLFRRIAIDVGKIDLGKSYAPIIVITLILLQV